jgi:hypothetical protein
MHSRVALLYYSIDATLHTRADAAASRAQGGNSPLDFVVENSWDKADVRATKSKVRAVLCNQPLAAQSSGSAGMVAHQQATGAAAPAASPVTSMGAALRPRGPKIALCIGIGAYESPISSLGNPVHDASDVAAALARVGYHTITLFDRGATKKGMRQALEEFTSRLGRGGVAFFFFAGHGLTGLDGKNYLLPVNGVEYLEDLEDDALSLEKVNNQLAGSGCLLHVVVADACRNVPGLRARSRAAVPRGLSVCSAAPAEVGSLLAYSCDLGKTASDGQGRNGAFTTALLRHLTTPELHVENVFTRAARDCQEATKQNAEPQRPWKSANLTHEHVCLF